MRSPSRKMSLAIVALVLFTSRPVSADSAQTGTASDDAATWVLEEIQSVPNANAKLTQGSDGNVYGTFITDYGGFGPGSIFKIDAAGNFSTLHSFPNGESASRLAVGSDGALYGTTCEGCGAYLTYATSDVFRIDPLGNYTKLVTLPIWAATTFVLGSDGSLYGALGYDDCTFGDCVYGNLYKVSSMGDLTILPGRRQGAVPTAVGSDGALYGGIPNYTSGGGYVFRLDTAGNYSTPHVFGVNDGDGSNFVLGSDSWLYGLGDYTGAEGVVFRFDATHFMPIRAFGYNEGSRLLAPLVVGSDGAIYGVAQYGGGNGGGTAYRISTAGTFSLLTSFDGSVGVVNQALARARNGVLYATRGENVVSVISSPGTVESYEFAPSFQARDPYARPLDALVQGNDCALYGAYRDSSTNGRVFRIFELGHLCQAISFDPLSDRVLSDSTFAVDATASSALPVSFTAEGGCSVSGDQVTITGGGPCTLTASQAGDSRFGPAENAPQSFNVSLDFAGFLPPLKNPPALNRANSGQTVPVRFNLGADAGREVFAPGSPTVREVSCANGEPRGEPWPAQGWGLFHRSSRYLYTWRTERRWAGTCRELSLELVDGSVHTAYFRFPERRPR